MWPPQARTHRRAGDCAAGVGVRRKPECSWGIMSSTQAWVTGPSAGGHALLPPGTGSGPPCSSGSAQPYLPEDMSQVLPVPSSATWFAHWTVIACDGGVIRRTSGTWEQLSPVGRSAGTRLAASCWKTPGPGACRPLATLPHALHCLTQKTEKCFGEAEGARAAQAVAWSSLAFNH